MEYFRKPLAAFAAYANMAAVTGGDKRVTYNAWKNLSDQLQRKKDELKNFR